MHGRSFIGAALVIALPSMADVGAQRIGSAPIHLYRDSSGRAYALQLPRGADTTLGRHYLSPTDFDALAAAGARLAYLAEHPSRELGPCTAEQVPADFDIAFVAGTVFGNIAQCAPGTRPAEARSFALDFVLFSSGYRGEAAHTVVMPWFKNALHGHGIYVGDTSAIPCMDGRDARYNTRIEAWSQWAGHGMPPNPYWTSTGATLADSCGEPLRDGWSTSSGDVSSAYRIDVRSSVDQWVRYDVSHWDGVAWRTHTPPVVRDVRYAAWRTGPGVFDAQANGVLVGSSGPLGPSSGTAWFVAIRSLRIRWIEGWSVRRTARAIEFHHAGLDHYFMTSNAAEIADLDGGVHAGWARTGETFAVGGSDASHAEPVCRFYGLPSAGLDSHFLSAHAGECAEVANRFAEAWRYESADVFRVDLPDTASGRCPPGTAAVYRMWNGRLDSNHRYTSDPAIVGRMRARGFVAEGYGPEGVAMCAPRSP